VYRVELAAKSYNAEVVDGEQLLKLQITLGGKGPDPDDLERLVTEVKKLAKEANPVAAKLLENLPERAGHILWWKMEVDKIGFSRFGDEGTFSPGQTFCPDLVGYPGLGIPNDFMRATLDSKPSVGPSDTVMVTVQDARSDKTVRR